jgi:glucuronoarabinoxylan endo-1,4-beta-xylanase
MKWLRSRRRCAAPTFLSIAALIAAGAPAARADSTVVVNSNLLEQQMEGFGASSAWVAGTIRSFPTAERNTILDDLFSTTTGAGLSMVRQRIPTEAEPSPGVWDWSVDDDTLWLAQEAISRGVTTVWATPWTPEPWMKSNDNLDYGGYLLPSHYQEYANYLATYVEHEQSVLPAGTFSAVSLQNEPDEDVSYESCLWTSAQFHDFLKYDLIPTFERDHLTTHVIMPEHSWWDDSFASDTLADLFTSQYLWAVATHDYGGTIAPFTDAQARGKATWETEVSNLGGNDSSIVDGLSWAITLHQTVTTAGASAWHYWWLLNPGTDGEGLINVDQANQTYLVNTRLWTIGNFSRFVRPGFHLIGLSSNNPESGVYTSAFRDTATGKIVVVAINDNSNSTNLTVDLPTYAVGSMEAYRTSATQNLAAIGSVGVSNHVFLTTLPAQSVTTFAGQGGVEDLAVPIRVHAAGGAVGSFGADVDYAGGNTYSVTAPITLSGVTNPAPMAVYQTQRWGRFIYTFPSLAPHTSYLVRLHFAETYWTQVGQRLFDVSINREPVLTNFDILKTAGGPNRALVEQFTVNTGAANAITIQFSNGPVDNAMVSGIEILPAG